MMALNADNKVALLSIVQKINYSDNEECRMLTDREECSLEILPETYDDYLKVSRLPDWPTKVTSEEMLGRDTNLMGAPEDIFNELVQFTPVDLAQMNELEKRLNQFDEKLNYFADRIFEKNPQIQVVCPKKGEEEEVRKVPSFLRRRNIRKEQKERELRKKLQSQNNANGDIRKTVDNCSFPGIREGELIEIPGQVEVPQILHRVTKAQDFNAGFKRFWKKIFQSEASIAMMQDSFWWIFLELFQKTQNATRSHQGKLFDRVADSFVSLFGSINEEVKDKFFQHYPNCIAQGIFAAFCDAFPDSTNIFDRKFKQKILDIVYLWITGALPTPGEWRTWDLSRLEPRVLKLAILDDSASLPKKRGVATKLEMEDFHKTMKSLTSHNSQTLQVVPTHRNDIPTSASRQAQCGTPRLDVLESHVVGAGPEHYRALFSLEGQSPLVAHFLHMHGMTKHPEAGKKVRRTLIRPEVGERKQTYRELVAETLRKSETLSREYQKICEETRSDLAKLKRENLDAARKIEKLKKDLKNCGNAQEADRLGQKILMDIKREQTAAASNELVKETAAQTMMENLHDAKSDSANEDEYTDMVSF